MRTTSPRARTRSRCSTRSSALRVGRGLTTVVDTLGLDADRRAAWRALAAGAGVPCVAVAFDTPAARVPGAQPGAGQARSRPTCSPRSCAPGRRSAPRWPAEGFDDVIAPEPVRVVPAAVRRRLARRPRGAQHGAARPGCASACTSASSLPRRRTRRCAAGCARSPTAAEAAGFDAIYVMDHFRQIPQVGRPLDDMLESFTTLGYLAACTERVRLGALVAGVTHRSVPLLAKIVATLDVLSGGRAVCGLGLGWFAAEQAAYGWRSRRSPTATRCSRTRCSCCPLLWGPGSKPFHGRVLDVPEALVLPAAAAGARADPGRRRQASGARCGSRRSYADAANVFGDLDTVRRKAPCCARTARTSAATRTRSSSRTSPPSWSATTTPRRGAGRAPPAAAAQRRELRRGRARGHGGRPRRSGSAPSPMPVSREVMVRLVDVGDPESVARMGDVIAAVRGT